MSFKTFVVNPRNFEPAEFHHRPFSGSVYSQLSTIVTKWKEYNASGDDKGLSLDTNWVSQLFLTESSIEELKSCAYEDVRYMVDNSDELMMMMTMRIHPENNLLNNFIGRGGFLWNLGKKGLEAIGAIDNDADIAKKNWKKVKNTLQNAFRAVLHCEDKYKFTYLQLYKMDKLYDLKALLTTVSGSSLSIANEMEEDILIEIVRKEYKGSAANGSKIYYKLFDETVKMCAELKKAEVVPHWNDIQGIYIRREHAKRTARADELIEQLEEQVSEAESEVEEAKENIKDKQDEYEILQSDYKGSDGIFSHLVDRASKEALRKGFNGYKPSNMPEISKGMADELEIRQLKRALAKLASLPTEIKELENEIPKLEKQLKKLREKRDKSISNKKNMQPLEAKPRHN
jgi:polyhydroxyalkanoate synthesis regulator phasin